MWLALTPVKSKRYDVTDVERVLHLVFYRTAHFLKVIGVVGIIKVTEQPFPLVLYLVVSFDLLQWNDGVLVVPSGIQGPELDSLPELRYPLELPVREFTLVGLLVNRSNLIRPLPGPLDLRPFGEKS